VPYTGRDMKNRYQRTWARTCRHPGWRQVWIDNGGMCAKCGAVDFLELHAPFREETREDRQTGQTRLPCRELLCSYCHGEVEADGGFCRGEYNTDKHWPSMLTQDVQWEIDQAGGYDAWVKKFGLIDRFACMALHLMDEADDSAALHVGAAAGSI